MDPIIPRILVKTDEQSSIGRGCVLYGAHFRPEIAKIVWAAAIGAQGWADELHLTEGWRDIRESRDLHKEFRALDITAYLLRAKLGKAGHQSIADEMIEILGFDYDVVPHGEGANLHIHAELDPH